MINIDNFSLSLILNKLDNCIGSIKYKMVCKKWYYILKQFKYPKCIPYKFMGYILCSFHNKKIINKIIT